MPDPEKSRRRPAGKKPPPPPKPRKPAMTEPKATSSDVFEIDRIRRLVELMKEHDLSEVDVRESRQRIRICRGPKEGPRPAYGPPPPPPPSAQASAAAKVIPAESASITFIKSPMVGTYYGRPN